MSRAPVINNTSEIDFVTRGPNLPADSNSKKPISIATSKTKATKTLRSLVKYEAEQEIGPHAAGDSHREGVLETVALCRANCKRSIVSPNPPPAPLLHPWTPRTGLSSLAQLVVYPLLLQHWHQRRPAAQHPTCKRVTTAPPLHLAKASPSLPAEDDTRSQETLEDSERHIYVAVRVAARVHPRRLGRQHIRFGHRGRRTWAIDTASGRAYVH
jgi:hypothetical protein